MADDHAQTEPLESREPSVEDVVELCRNLNQAGARYMIIGGFAMRAAGFDRRTMDIDLMIEPGATNEALVIGALSYLPDNAAAEIKRCTTGFSSRVARTK